MPHVTNLDALVDFAETYFADTAQVLTNTADAIHVFDVVVSGLDRMHLVNTFQMKRRLRPLILPIIGQQSGCPSQPDILANTFALKPKGNPSMVDALSVAPWLVMYAAMHVWGNTRGPTMPLASERARSAVDQLMRRHYSCFGDGEGALGPCLSMLRALSSAAQPDHSQYHEHVKAGHLYSLVAPGTAITPISNRPPRHQPASNVFIRTCWQRLGWDSGHL